MISKEMLLEIGKNKGLTTKEHIEKDYFQDRFLFNLFKKTNKLVFKGGTSLYKFYNLKRFSEDLDFSVLNDLNFTQIENTIKDLIESTSYFKIKSIKKTKASLLIKISCIGILTRYNTLRIDISTKNRVLLGFDLKTYIPPYIDINPFLLKILKLEEIVAEKIHSILSREKARDLYDLFFLLRISKFNKQIISQKLKIFEMKLNIPILKKRISDLSNVWEKELKPFILEKEIINFDIAKKFVFDKLK